MKVGEKECTRVVSGAIYQRAGVRASQEGNGCANETRGDHRANEPASGWVRKQSRREREQGVCPRAQRGRHESKRRGWLLKSSSRSSLSAAIRARPPTDPDRARTPCRPASRLIAITYPGDSTARCDSTISTLWYGYTYLE